MNSENPEDDQRVSIMPTPEPSRVPRLVGRSECVARMRDFATRAALNGSIILICGETGTGKDRLAKVIHRSSRSGRSFVVVDCGTLSSTLVEAELFGHIKGAFTGACRERIGLVRSAEDGTLFLNEVHNLTLELQGKILQVLDPGVVRPVGGSREFRIQNTRIIAATNRDLVDAVRKGCFRADLLHRLRILEYTVPPLRDHAEDIPDLVAYFLKKENIPKTFSSEAMDALAGYDWPGNVRELKNVVVMAAFRSGEQDRVDAEHVLPSLTGNAREEVIPLWHDVESAYFREVLERAEGSLRRAAELAGITATKMRKKVRRYHSEYLVSTPDIPTVRVDRQ